MEFEGIARTGDGKLKIIIVAVTATLPAGVTMFDGLARSSDGSLYVVLS